MRLNPDFSVFEIIEDCQKLYGGLSDNPQNLPLIVESIIRACIWYPDDLAYRIATAYAMIPSVRCNSLPHLILCGESGSGKSALTKIIAGLYGFTLQGANSTAVSLRNEINFLRFEAENPNDVDEDCERSAFILFEDMNIDTLKGDSYLFQLLKSSIDRKSDTITISGGGGMNLKFRTFCPKVMSTIQPFWRQAQWVELNRRIIVLRHSRPSSELDLFDVDYLSFEPLNRNTFEVYWDKMGSTLRSNQLVNIKTIPKRFGALGKMWIDFYAVYNTIFPDQNKVKELIDFNHKTMMEFSTPIEDFLVDNLPKYAPLIGKERVTPSTLLQASKLGTCESVRIIDQSILTVLIDKAIKDREIMKVSNDELIKTHFPAIGFKRIKGLWVRNY